MANIKTTAFMLANLNAFSSTPHNLFQSTNWWYIANCVRSFRRLTCVQSKSCMSNMSCLSSMPRLCPWCRPLWSRHLHRRNCDVKNVYAKIQRCHSRLLSKVDNGHDGNRGSGNPTHGMDGDKHDLHEVNNISSIIQPLPVKPYNDPDGINVGEELAGSLKKDDLLKLMNEFYRRPEIRRLATESGLDSKLFHRTYISFRRFCAESASLPVDLHVVLSDILQQAGHVDDIFPYFMNHARSMFPHLDCMEDLCKISDLRLPANWYPDARASQRKIIYHAGPTNSGKTYHALERLFAAKSGVYCGPLRLLANEVFNKSNQSGTPCDLITGEERRYIRQDGEPSPHVACTVEMASIAKPYEVAVIDEIQMLRDTQRGWAWTRALLGMCAQEVHLCGEASAIDLVKDLAADCGDVVEVRKYKRLTSLTVLDRPLESLERVRPGDCIVCFSKNDIFTVSKQLERRGVEVAVIYGTLPPGTKLAQAQKFNNPENPCKVMVATDAIGMGLNLNIKRIVFHSLVKTTINENGEKEMDIIPPTMALQISGRAGRYNSQFDTGEVTTYKHSDLQLLKKLLNTPVEPIEQSGLHPTAEQVELFAYHLPKATLSNLIDIFVTLAQLDNNKYFLCNMEDFKFLADMIEHLPLALRARYVFCCAPIPKKQPFVCTMFLKFARQYSRAQPLTFDWLCQIIGWPLQTPQTIADLVHLEAVFDVLDLYLWLSYRFMELFPDTAQIRDMQRELDEIIQNGVQHITRLLRNTEVSTSTATTAPITDEDDFVIAQRSKRSTFSGIAVDGNEGDAGGVKVAIASLRQKENVGAVSRSEFTGSTSEKKRGKKKAWTSENDALTPSTGDGDEVTLRLKPGERLTDRLLKQGLLTKEMLRKLQQEMVEQQELSESSDDDSGDNGSRQKK